MCLLSTKATDLQVVCSACRGRQLERHSAGCCGACPMEGEIRRCLRGESSGESAAGFRPWAVDKKRRRTGGIVASLRGGLFDGDEISVGMASAVKTCIEIVVDLSSCQRGSPNRGKLFRHPQDSITGLTHRGNFSRAFPCQINLGG